MIKLSGIRDKGAGSIGSLVDGERGPFGIRGEDDHQDDEPDPEEERPR
ncbi:hypothetical protein [Streptomyces sp. WAC07149]|nr:hypothetical protein [Streptomyces sp. WAC07149]